MQAVVGRRDPSKGGQKGPGQRGGGGRSGMGGQQQMPLLGSCCLLGWASSRGVEVLGVVGPASLAASPLVQAAANKLVCLPVLNSCMFGN